MKLYIHQMSRETFRQYLTDTPTLLLAVPYTASLVYLAYIVTSRVGNGVSTQALISFWTSFSALALIRTSFLVLTVAPALYTTIIILATVWFLATLYFIHIDSEEQDVKRAIVIYLLVLVAFLLFVPLN